MRIVDLSPDVERGPFSRALLAIQYKALPYLGASDGTGYLLDTTAMQDIEGMTVHFSVARSNPPGEFFFSPVFPAGQVAGCRAEGPVAILVRPPFSPC